MIVHRRSISVKPNLVGGVHLRGAHGSLDIAAFYVFRAGTLAMLALALASAAAPDSLDVQSAPRRQLGHV